MKRILVIDLGQGSDTTQVGWLGRTVEITRRGCGGEAALAREWLAAQDGQVDALALDGLPAQLALGATRRPHEIGATLVAAHTPVVDGHGVRDGLERWGVNLAARAQPGIFAEKRVLMVPGLNHTGLAQALGRHSSAIQYADPVVFFGLPDFPGVGARQTLDQVAGPTLERLKNFPFRRLFPCAGPSGAPRAQALFEWADILAGDIGAIRRYAPCHLERKLVVVEWAGPEDLEDLRQRGVSIVITLMPSLAGRGELASQPAAVVEALLAALRADPNLPLSEDTYLDLIADLDWAPALRELRPDEAGLNRFAFVIHPLDVAFIHAHRGFGWTRHLPDALVEAVAAYFPPIYLARITGGRSPATGQRIEGHLISLGATPRQMMRHGERFTYVRLNQAARMAQRRGARIMGLGAFTSVVGDAGITVAHESEIAITSGNSLTVAATLEAAKQAMLKLGQTDLTRGKAMIVGATGSIGSVCARLLAQAIQDVVLVSIEPDKLIALKHLIRCETPAARAAIATRTDELIGECDLVVTATSAFGQRVINLSRCKPGAVICDVARPPDISPAEAALRPDVLVIESGEVLIPGDIEFGYDIGLPPKTAYACLAETALLAMEGRFEDYTLGRNIEIERVKEIYRLFKKHGFQLAPLRSYGRYLTDEEFDCKRALAEQLRNDPAQYARVQAETAAQLAAIAPMAKGVPAARGTTWRQWAGLGLGLGLAGILFWRLRPRAARGQAR
jgi:predicted amino acid dehydrogenase